MDELAGDLSAAGDLVQPAPHVRPDGRGQPAGVRDRRGDGDPGDHQPGRGEPAPGGAPGHRPAGGGRRDRGHRDPVRGSAVRDFRRGHHIDLDGGRELVPRLLHRAGRRGADGEHDARRDRARRYRFGPVRDYCVIDSRFMI